MPCQAELNVSSIIHRSTGCFQHLLSRLLNPLDENSLNRIPSPRFVPSMVGYRWMRPNRLCDDWIVGERPEREAQRLLCSFLKSPSGEKKNTHDKTLQKHFQPISWERDFETFKSSPILDNHHPASWKFPLRLFAWFCLCNRVSLLLTNVSILSGIFRQSDWVLFTS